MYLEVSGPSNFFRNMGIQTASNRSKRTALVPRDRHFLTPLGGRFPFRSEIPSTIVMEASRWCSKMKCALHRARIRASKGIVEVAVNLRLANAHLQNMNFSTAAMRRAKSAGKTCPMVPMRKESIPVTCPGR